MSLLGNVKTQKNSFALILRVLQTYFADLTAHHRLLASLRDLSDRSTRRRYEQQHAELDQETRVLQDTAEQEHRRLQSIIHRWEEFVSIFTTERDWLHKMASHRQKAADVAVSDTVTLHELHTIVAEYEDIKLSFDSRKSFVMQV